METRKGGLTTFPIRVIGVIRGKNLLRTKRNYEIALQS